MNKFIQSLKDLYQKLVQLLGNLLGALGYIYDFLLRAGTALYQVVKNDVLAVQRKIWGSRG